MIFDVRTYDIAPGKIGAYVKVFETYGVPVAERNGLKLVGFFTSRIGRLNQVLHIWAYDDLNQMEKLRAARDADPGWAEYRKANAGMIVRQEDKIMDGAAFSPLK
jgi:hypothetical protein